MESGFEDESFVLRSEYRFNVLRSLAGAGRLTPTMIADWTEIRQPHVSRALSELQDRDLVDLTVDEDQHKGRLYALTERGVTLWQSVNEVTWQGPMESIPDEHRGLVAFLQDRIGESLIVVGYYSRAEIHNYYAREDVREQLSEGNFQETVELLVKRFSVSETNAGEKAGQLRYAIQSFENFVRIIIYLKKGFIGIGLDLDFHFEIPTLMEECRDILDDGGAHLV